MQVEKIAIIGLGLIGGSLARALRFKAGVDYIVAVDKDAESIKQAIDEGVIKEGFSELDTSVFDSNIIFICTPVKASLEYIKLLSGRVKKGCIITDVCSTKSEIINLADSLDPLPRFVGGHPMAGAEKIGYSFGFPELFENANYILMPGKGADKEATQCVADLVKSIGAIPFEMDISEHDYFLACISHLPHVAATVLVNLVREAEEKSGKGTLEKLAAGGFRGITRIASSSPEMWENIIFSNKEKIKGVLARYVELINEFISSIEAGENERIHTLFKTAKEFRDKV